jgi:hypothetical protein
MYRAVGIPSGKDSEDRTEERNRIPETGQSGQYSLSRIFRTGKPKCFT